MDELESDAVERITVALARAIAKAKVLVEMDAERDELRDLVRHARDLHGLLLEQMVAAEPTLTERLRGMSEAFLENLGRLEEILSSDDAPPPSQPN